MPIWEIRGLNATRTKWKPLGKRKDKPRVYCWEYLRKSKPEHTVRITSAPRGAHHFLGLSCRDVGGGAAKGQRWDHSQSKHLPSTPQDAFPPTRDPHHFIPVGGLPDFNRSIRRHVVGGWGGAEEPRADNRACKGRLVLLSLSTFSSLERK